MSADEGKRSVMRDAIAAAGAEHRELVKPAEQLELMAVPTRFTGARADALQLALRHRHGAGRPPGAQNLGTKEFREYLLGRGVSPLQQMMQWAMHTPTSLAAELQCSRIEAMKLLKDLWGELAPYLHQRMPLAVEVDQRTAGVLILGHISADQAAAIGARMGVAALELRPNEIEENPTNSTVEGEPSHGVASHDEAKP
jgi:hypothetical protein